MNKVEVTGLEKRFGGGKSLLRRPLPTVHAVRGLGFEVEPGEILGVVGESGCGKSTVAKMLVGLQAPSAGEIRFDGEPLAGPKARVNLKRLSRRVQYIFQDPNSSLNPRKTIREILSAPLKHLRGMTPAEQTERLEELMRHVNLRPEFLERYPHEFSGGQAQRIGVARALAAEPDILILDEPVSALDVSVQAQVLNLLKQLRETFNLTYLFISHDLGVVRNFCDRVVVMYFGRIVEEARVDDLFNHPIHPYTQRLLDSVPGNPSVKLEPESDAVVLPDPYHPPSGCSFAPRCPFAERDCEAADPELAEHKPQHRAACYHPLIHS